MYQIIIKKPAKKFLDRLPIPERKRILSAIEGLPHEGDVKPIRGRAGYYRLRVGPYRIIYAVDHGRLIVCVTDADSRGQIYKRY